MAQAGYTPIQLYFSSTPTNTPSAGNLSNGELAINIADGKLFYKDSGGVVKVIAGTGGTGVVAGSNTQIQFNNNGVFGASANLTWDGSFLTAASIKNSALTSGRVTYAGASGLLTDSANMTFNGTRLTVADFADSSLTAGRVTYATTSGNLTDSANLTFDGTTLTAANITSGGSWTFSGGTANGVLYLNGSKVATSGSALTFTGTRLGIGETSPVSGLTVKSGNGDQVTLNNAGERFTQLTLQNNGTSKGALWVDNTNSLLELFGYSGMSLTFSANGSEQMRLTSTGLGIGTSSPSAKLVVASGNTLLGHNTLDNYGGNVDIRSAYQVRAANTPTQLFVANSSGTQTADAGGAIDFGGYQDSFSRAYSYARIQGLASASTGPGGYLSFMAQNTGGAIVERMRITSGGDVGIGTSSPSQRLHVTGSSSATTVGTAATIQITSSTGLSAPAGDVYLQAVIDSATAGDRGTALAFFTGRTSGIAERARIDSLGNLGLGVTPSAWYTGYTAQNIGYSGAIWSNRTSSDTNTVMVGLNSYLNSGATNWIYQNNGNASRYVQVSGQHQWYYAASGTAGNAITWTQAMTLDASGNLALGTTTAGTRLVLATDDSATTGQLRFARSVDVSYFWEIGRDNNLTGAFVFSNASGGAKTERVRITSGGDVGIGTSSPTSGAKLDVNGQIVAQNGSTSSLGYAFRLALSSGMYLYDDGVGANVVLQANANNNQLYLQRTGNVGIGTSSPSAKLHVAGTVIIDNADANNELTFSGTQFTNVLSASTSGFQLGTTGAGYLAFLTSNSERARITSTGTLQLSSNYQEGVVTANTSTAYTISLASGTVQILTLTGNCTFTFPTATSGQSFTLLLKQDATGSRTVTWPAAVKWPSGTAPTITSTASKLDKYVFISDGTNWYGSTAGQNYTV